MREILFRGQRKGEGNEWLYGDLNHVNGDVFIFNRDSDSLNSPEWYEVIEATIGQFTGLLDKNGKKIFEGDLLKIPYNHTAREGVHVVHYYGACFETSSILFSDLDTANKYSLSWILGLGAEVIGSIDDKTATT